MLCKNESRDPEHCLKEGRRVTRCATDLYVLLSCFATCIIWTDIGLTCLGLTKCERIVYSSSTRIGIV